MDKRIAICIMAALLVLVVTAAYAPKPGGYVPKADTETETLEEPSVEKMLQEVLDNQAKILTELETLKANQAKMQTDLKYVRSKVH